MAKVYVVTDGEYSDYHIKCVCSTRKIAERATKCMGGDVEEWSLDAADEYCNMREQGYGLWFVEMWVRDGEVTWSTGEDYGTDYTGPHEPDVFLKQRTIQPRITKEQSELTPDDYEKLPSGMAFLDRRKTIVVQEAVYEKEKLMRVVVWAKDEKHAIKIANEKRTQYKAGT